jgi:hypothetical protein
LFVIQNRNYGHVAPVLVIFGTAVTIYGHRGTST